MNSQTPSSTKTIILDRVELRIALLLIFAFGFAVGMLVSCAI
jgi:hypothetical protein